MQEINSRNNREISPIKLHAAAGRKSIVPPSGIRKILLDKFGTFESKKHFRDAINKWEILEPRRVYLFNAQIMNDLIRIGFGPIDRPHDAIEYPSVKYYGSDLIHGTVFPVGKEIGLTIPDRSDKTTYAEQTDKIISCCRLFMENGYYADYKLYGLTISWINDEYSEGRIRKEFTKMRTLLEVANHPLSTEKPLCLKLN